MRLTLPRILQLWVASTTENIIYFVYATARSTHNYSPVSGKVVYRCRKGETEYKRHKNEENRDDGSRKPIRSAVASFPTVVASVVVTLCSTLAAAVHMTTNVFRALDLSYLSRSDNTHCVANEVTRRYRAPSLARLVK